jgi:hypothetical protein
MCTICVNNAHRVVTIAFCMLCCVLHDDRIVLLVQGVIPDGVFQLHELKLLRLDDNKLSGYSLLIAL